LNIDNFLTYSFWHSDFLSIFSLALLDENHPNGSQIGIPYSIETNITTPGYGFAMPGGVIWIWTFVAPVGTWVRFRLSNDFARSAILEGSNIIIYDGDSVRSPMIGEYVYKYFAASIRESLSLIHFILLFKMCSTPHSEKELPRKPMFSCNFNNLALSPACTIPEGCAGGGA
jgi:hypothetical protein